MASVEMIKETDATGKVKDLYEDIKKTLGIEFVPNLYKVMAPNSSVLEASWTRIRTVMHPGRLDKLTKEIIAMSVSAMSACPY